MSRNHVSSFYMNGLLHFSKVNVNKETKLLITLFKHDLIVCNSIFSYKCFFFHPTPLSFQLKTFFSLPFDFVGSSGWQKSDEYALEVFIWCDNLWVSFTYKPLTTDVRQILPIYVITFE